MIEIVKFWRTGDKDWLPATRRAQETWTEGLSTANKSRGFTLLFEPIVYEFSGQIELVRGMSLVGSGGSFHSNGTVFQFPQGVSGIVVRAELYGGAAMPPDSGFGSVIERICVQGTRSAADQAIAHGVVMNNRAVMRDVYVDGFAGDGIHIDATLHEESEVRSASGWLIQNCTVANCGQNGLFVKGADANAGCAIALDLRNNLGWGVRDESFLGNSYIACVAHNNRGGSYSAPNPIGSTAFLNCYAEGDQPRAQISRTHFTLGGVFDAVPPPGETVGPASVTAEGGAGVAFPNSARAFGLAFATPESTIEHWRLPTMVTGTTWTDPAAVTAADGIAAKHSLAVRAISSELRATGFGFSVPSDAQISGITIEISRRVSVGAVDGVVATDSEVMLLKAGAKIGKNAAKAEVWSTKELTQASFGSSTGLAADWGAVLLAPDWTPADINNPGFGVSITVAGDPLQPIDVEIDCIRMFVWYVINPGGRIRVSTSIGSSEAANVAMSLERYAFNDKADPSALPYRLAFGHFGTGTEHVRGWWDMNLGAMPSVSPFRFSTESADTRYGPGQFWMPRGYFIGNPSEGSVPVIRTVAGTGVPTSAPGAGGQWFKGDRVLNATPDPDVPALKWAGWICVASPTEGDDVGQWLPFGAFGAID